MGKKQRGAPLSDVHAAMIDSVGTRRRDDAIWIEKGDDGTFRITACIADKNYLLNRGRYLSLRGGTRVMAISAFINENLELSNPQVFLAKLRPVGRTTFRDMVTTSFFKEDELQIWLQAATLLCKRRQIINPACSVPRRLSSTQFGSVHSTFIIQEMMIFVGEAVAQWAHELNMPLVFRNQTSSDQFSFYSTQSSVFFPLGVSHYCYCTSPLLQKDKNAAINTEQVIAQLLGKPLPHTKDELDVRCFRLNSGRRARQQIPKGAQGVPSF